MTTSNQGTEQSHLSRAAFLRGVCLGVPATVAGLAAFGTPMRWAAAHSTSSGDSIVSIMDFGEAGAGNTLLDTLCLDQALGTGKHVYLPPGNYLINRTMTVDTDGQTVFSDLPIANERNAATLEWAGESTGPMIRVTAHKTSFHGLRLRPLRRDPDKPLPRGDRELVGIHLEKVSNTDDVDCEVSGCIFTFLDEAIHIVGRGLRAANNSFVVLNKGIVINWPDSGVEHKPEEKEQPLPHGLRSFYVHNNRVHSVPHFVLNTGPYAKDLTGLLLADNLLDIGEGLFSGSVNNSAITGNVVCHADRTVLRFDLCRNTSIIGNVLSGSDVSQPMFGILFKGSHCEDVVISGNVFSRMLGDGVVFDAAVQNYTTLTGNVFRKIGDNKPHIRGAIRFSQDAHDFSIVGNSFKTNNPMVDNVIRVHHSSIQISGFEVIGNVFERNRTLFGPAWLDGGYNNIQG